MQALAISPSAKLAASPGTMVDPYLSANIYCENRLCEVVCRVVAPAWRQFREQSSGDGYLWLMRYRKAGEHLKSRWHGRESEADLWRVALDDAWAAYVDELPTDSSGQRQSQPMAPPIDEEDEAEAEHPDRTLLWTTYRRNRVSLGSKPYLDNDDFVSLMTRCLAQGTEILLDRLVADANGKAAHSLRQNLLIQALISAFSALPLTSRDRSLYLLYHRDSLLRYARRRNRHREYLASSQMSVILTRFDDEVQRMGDQSRRLVEQAKHHWRSTDSVGWDPVFESWRQSLAALFRYLDPICRDRAHYVDPFADSPIFPPLFKALNGFANQLGLDPFNEAFPYHLFISLTAPEELRQQPVRLIPEL